VRIGPTAVKMEIKGKPARLFYPVGESECWRTKDEIDLIKKYDLGDVEIIEGSWAVPSREPVKMFSGASRVIERSILDHASREYAKYIASISWGKFASIHSPLWNPVYASFITSRVRSIITEIALQHADDIIAIAVDGLLTESPLPGSMVSDSLGDLKVKRFDKIISLADYYRYSPLLGSDEYTWEVRDDGIIIKIRHPVEGRMFARVPFGSTKRLSPSNLTLSDLEKNVYQLNPPTPEEAIELFFTTREFIIE